MGSAEEAITCASCHPGGGPYQYDRDGNRYDSVDPTTVSPLDGDYYTYSTLETQEGTTRKPHTFDWRETGVMEADCFMCHLDPDAGRLTDATGVKTVTYNPRLRIFARRERGKVREVSLGLYPEAGWESAFPYMDPLGRVETAFRPGKFYADLDNPQAETRIYLRQPYVEGEGERYKSLEARRRILGNFFAQMPSAALMGWDGNQDGFPLTYVKLEREKKKFRARIYYQAAEFNEDDELEFPMLSSRETENGENKWTRVCAQCHAGYRDPINGSFRVRTWGLGMKADIVKRGEIWNPDAEETEPGYDVHAAGGLECTSCHSQGKPADQDWDEYVEAADHNFPKGMDSGNHVRDDLDNNPAPKNCTSCHLRDEEGPDPTEAHEKLFGSAAAVHMEKIACQACHVSRVRYWTFRSFDYSLGFDLNYDNRHFPTPQGMMEVQMAPYYGPIPTYGMGNVNWLVGSEETEEYATDQLSPVAYLMPDRPDDPYGQMYRQMTGRSDFSWSPVLNWYHTEKGAQIVPGNPITIQTWFDRKLKKVLYPREIAAAVKMLGQDKQGRRYAVLITGDRIYDKTGFHGQPDMKPEISTLEDIRKMRRALIKVLKKEGEKDPDPVLFLAAHYFKVSHGVLPADQALGAGGTCTVCHGGNGRTEERMVAFNANTIEGFAEGVAQGLILVDPEVDYLHPVDVDGDGREDFLGATQKEILEKTREELH